MFILFSFQFTTSPVPCASPFSTNCLLLSSPYLPPRSMLTIVQNNKDIILGGLRPSSDNSDKKEVQLLTDGYTEDLYWKSFAWPLSCLECLDCGGGGLLDAGGDGGQSWNTAENGETNRLILNGLERSTSSQKTIQLLSVTPAGTYEYASEGVTCARVFCVMINYLRVV